MVRFKTVNVARSWIYPFQHYYREAPLTQISYTLPGCCDYYAYLLCFVICTNGFCTQRDLFILHQIQRSQACSLFMSSCVFRVVLSSKADHTAAIKMINTLFISSFLEIKSLHSFLLAHDCHASVQRIRYSRACCSTHTLPAVIVDELRRLFVDKPGRRR